MQTATLTAALPFVVLGSAWAQGSPVAEGAMPEVAASGFAFTEGPATPMALPLHRSA